MHRLGLFLSGRPGGRQRRQRTQQHRDPHRGRRRRWSRYRSPALLARRIVCNVKVGDKLAIGDTYGLIRFGSRLDTYLPAGSIVMVTTGTALAGRRNRCWPSCDEAAHQARPS